jgi:uncharacterized cupin superfamily protein
MMELDTPMTKPVLNIDEVQLRDHAHGAHFEAKLGRIGPVVGAKKLGCQLHIVPAGKKAFPRHAHHVNEEMMFILSGRGTYRHGDQEFPIRAGDVVAAPAGDAASAHQIVNSGAGELRYLCFSTRLDPDVVEYPDSGKFGVASMIPEDKGLPGARIAYIGRLNSAAGYWDGEE